jgi:hypothetical protein
VLRRENASKVLLVPNVATLERPPFDCPIMTMRKVVKGDRQETCMRKTKSLSVGLRRLEDLVSEGRRHIGAPDHPHAK